MGVRLRAGEAAGQKAGGGRGWGETVRIAEMFAILFVFSMLMLTEKVMKDKHCELESRVATIDHQPVENWCKP